MHFAAHLLIFDIIGHGCGKLQLLLRDHFGCAQINGLVTKNKKDMSYNICLNNIVFV